MVALRQSRRLVYAAAPRDTLGASLAARRGVPYHADALASQARSERHKELLEQYGDHLVCVRYRYDAQRKTRLKTVELIVAQRNWNPPAPRFADDALVSVRGGFTEVELRQRVTQAGGTWNPSRKTWELRYAHVVALKLQARIMEEEGHLILDAGAEATRMHMQMPQRPLHVDACIQDQMRASNPGCFGQQYNSSEAPPQTDEACR